MALPKTFDELVALGEIHKWSEAPDAAELASGERFNRNEKTAIAQALNAYVSAVQYANEKLALKADAQATQDDLATKATKATTLSGYNIADAYTKTETNDAISTAVQAIIGLAPSELDTLKEIADKIIAGESVTSALISTVATKADAANVYTKAEIQAMAYISNADITALN